MSDAGTGWSDSLFGDAPLPSVSMTPATATAPASFRFDTNMPAAPSAPSSLPGGGWYNGAEIASGTSAASGAALPAAAPQLPYTMQVPKVGGGLDMVIVDPSLADLDYGAHDAAPGADNGLGLSGHATQDTQFSNLPPASRHRTESVGVSWERGRGRPSRAARPLRRVWALLIPG